jgi:hypothetical protein
MAEPEPESEPDATCVECAFWQGLGVVGAIAPPVDPEFADRCRARGLNPEQHPHLAAFGKCRRRAPRAPGPVVWPLLPALEPACSQFHPRVRS